MAKVRFLSIALVLGAAISGCGGEEQPPPKVPEPVVAPPPAPVAEAPKEEPKPQLSPAEAMKKTMMEYGAAMNAHDGKRLAALYTENAVLKSAGAPQDVTGRENIGAYFGTLFTTFTNFKSGATRVFMKGDTAACEVVWTATHGGDLGPLKATEKPVGGYGGDVIWFTPEGLIKEHHAYYDGGAIMSQIGASKQKARGVPGSLPASPQIVASTGGGDEQKNLDASKKMMAAFEKKSEADFIGGVSDDVLWDDMTQPETMKGKDAAKKYFKAMSAAFPDGKLQEANVWAAGEYVISESVFTGTHKGPLMGIPATKKNVNMHSVDVIQYKDGKAIHGWSYGNSLEMMQQLGLLQQAGKAPTAKADAKTAAPKADAKPADAKPATAAPKK